MFSVSNPRRDLSEADPPHRSPHHEFMSHFSAQERHRMLRDDLWAGRSVPLLLGLLVVLGMVVLLINMSLILP